MDLELKKKHIHILDNNSFFLNYWLRQLCVEVLDIYSYRSLSNNNQSVNQSVNQSAYQSTITSNFNPISIASIVSIVSIYSTYSIISQITRLVLRFLVPFPNQPHSPHPPRLIYLLVFAIFVVLDPCVILLVSSPGAAESLNAILKPFFEWPSLSSLHWHGWIRIRILIQSWTWMGIGDTIGVK